MRSQEYFKNFFEEKEIPYSSWELKDNEETTHFIDSEIVIEYIKTSLSTEDQEHIRNKLVELDFFNLPILPFLKYVAGYIINLGGS